MKKFLMFMDDADDAVVYPVERLYSMICPSNALINLKFESSIGSGGTDGAAADLVALTITADTQKQVMAKISETIADEKGPSLIVVANDVKNAATTWISVPDGDANCTLTEKNYVTLKSTDGTSKTYVFIDDNATTVATGDILAESSDTGAGIAGPELIGGIGVAINLTGSISNQNAALVQLKAAIEHSNGHNGKILVSSVPVAANGRQKITLTQNVAGNAGNTLVLYSAKVGQLGFADGSVPTSGVDIRPAFASAGLGKASFTGGTDAQFIHDDITACAITIDT